MIHSCDRDANASDVAIVWAQLLQGWGGGFAVVTTQVSFQASVVHTDVASVTAIVLLWAEIGGAIGNALGYVFALLSRPTTALTMASSRRDLDEHDAEESCE